MRNYLIIDGVSSISFGVFISGNGTFTSPVKKYEEVEIPGRNGKLLMNTEPIFDNVDVTYNSFAFEDSAKDYPKVAKLYSADAYYRTFGEQLGALRAFLNSREGYFRLEDSYNPEEYRMAYYAKAFTPTVNRNLKAAEFPLVFTCKPQRFLKTGEMPIDYTSSSTIVNPYLFKSKPLIRAYGTGYFTISGVKVTIKAANGYTDIDCEAMECYKDTVNCNNNVVLDNGVFPVLKPGDNAITMSGITKLTITPRWWTI